MAVRLDDRELTTDEVAELLRRRPNTVKWWRRKGIGPKYRPGRPVTYRLGDVIAWRERRLRATADQK